MREREKKKCRYHQQCRNQQTSRGHCFGSVWMLVSRKPRWSGRRRRGKQTAATRNSELTSSTRVAWNSANRIILFEGTPANDHEDVFELEVVRLQMNDNLPREMCNSALIVHHCKKNNGSWRLTVNDIALCSGEIFHNLMGRVYSAASCYVKASDLNHLRHTRPWLRLVGFRFRESSGTLTMVVKHTSLYQGEQSYVGYENILEHPLPSLDYPSASVAYLHCRTTPSDGI